MAGASVEGIVLRPQGQGCIVETPSGRMLCWMRGRLRQTGVSPLAGDRVEVLPGAQGEGVIESVAPRRNQLSRPAVANVDRVVTVTSLVDPRVPPLLLDRFLALAEKARVRAVVVVNKVDLGRAQEILQVENRYRSVGYPVYPLSARLGEGVEPVRREIAQGGVTVLAGVTGVGKSSLFRCLIPGASVEVGQLTRQGHGRHTTKHTELFPVGDGYLADTPGFSALTLEGVEPGEVAGLFPEFRPFLGRCRFSDCRHLDDVGCAVTQAVGTRIDPVRYESYTFLLREAMEARRSH